MSEFRPDISTDQHKATAQIVGSIVQMVRVLPLEPLQEIVRNGDSYDTIAPILDPSGWMRNHKTNNRDTRIFGAVLKLGGELDEIAAKMEADR